MTDASPSALFVLFHLATVADVLGCHVPPWELKRADPGSGGLSFTNNTVSDAYTMARWTWRDSSGGFWDTRLRATLDGDEIIGGGFTYTDQYDNELAWTRWYRTKINGPIKWKYNSFASPPDSWWMTSVVPWGNITWGFKNQITDGSWVFKVGNDTLEPKNGQNFDGWSQGNTHKLKRSLQSIKNDELLLRNNQESSKEFDNEKGNIVETIFGYFMEIFQSDKTKEVLPNFGK